MSPGSSSSKLRWLWRAPARALGRARDLYVRSVTGCARYVPSDAAFGAYPVLVPAPLPRSYSCGSDWGQDDDDLRELIRAASQRQQRAAGVVLQGVVRSQSTASMARIDEDAPCEFGGGEGMYSRSRSYVGGGAAEGIRKSRLHGKVAAFG